MDRIGKIYGSCSFWQSDDVSFWGKTKYLIRKYTHFHLLHEFSSFERCFSYFFDCFYPITITRTNRFPFFRVFKMRGNSDFSLDMHFWGSDLYFCGLRANLCKKTNNRCMKRLVSIFFWESNIIFKPLWHRYEYIV